MRAKELVKQILTFSRRTKRELEFVDITYIIKEAIKMLRATLPSTIEIHQTSSVAPGCRILADSTEIHQVIMNLCTNAAHAMRDRGGRLEVDLREVVFYDSEIIRIANLASGTYIELRVTDNGNGMSEEVMAQIFDPFFTTKVVGEGTGMGLSVLRGIVENCKGTITVESKEGYGSTFYVYFPVTTIYKTPKIQDNLNLIQGNGHILFVDDEKAIAELSKKALERQGYSVTIANSGKEALEIILASPYLFDILVTDYTMPGMTGLDLTEKVKRIRPGIPVILCSGYSDRIDENSAVTFGIKAFVSKPFDRHKLSIAINDAIIESRSL
jgi:CheY-like chemotaxis protein/anti-sigma regulatory factor (Ser/Thr protein kinase)